MVQRTEWQSDDDFQAKVRRLLASQTADVVNIPARGFQGLGMLVRERWWRTFGPRLWEGV